MQRRPLRPNAWPVTGGLKAPSQSPPGVAPLGTGRMTPLLCWAILPKSVGVVKGQRQLLQFFGDETADALSGRPIVGHSPGMVASMVHVYRQSESPKRFANASRGRRSF